MPTDSLRLLGAFQLIHHGQSITLGQPRLEELLTLLALRPGAPVARVQIAYHFWPDSNERQARTNARNLFYKLRQVWSQVDGALAIDRTAITWREDAGIALDIQHFLACCDAAERCALAADRVHWLAEAVAWYRGELLPNCYADWVLAEREHLRRRFVSALEALIDGLLELRQYEEALQRARQLRDYDPLHEASYRRLMQIHSLKGDRVAALRVYHDCASMLEKELGVVPSAATIQLYAQLVQRGSAIDLQGVSATTQRPRLIGRHAEWQQLQQAWRTVQAGTAHAVIIWGDAGIGKTRLAEELLDWVQRSGYAGASSRSYAVQGTLSYAPITEWLRTSSVQPALVAVDDLWRVELARLLPELLTAHPNLPAPGPLTERWQQQRFFQSIVEGMTAVSGPLLLHLDDMQWSDQETLILLQFLLHSARTKPILLLGTVRTEDAVKNQPLRELVVALRHQNQLTELTLAPLSPAEVAELAEQTAGAAIPAESAQVLYAASEGHPLFLIETVRSTLTAIPFHTDARRDAAATAQANGLSSIPAKIYNLFVDRLGQLSATAQQVASTAAVIGRAFSYPVLQAATRLDELTLVDALDDLWTRRIIREQGADSYDFSHDYLREVTYQEISRARRRLLHRQVAAALATIHDANLDRIAGRLAAHYTQAGDSEKAFIYYHRAAKAALSQYALTQAEDLLDSAQLHAPDAPTLRIQLLQEQTLVFQYAMRLERWQENLDKWQILLNTLERPNLRLQMELELGYSEYERAATEPIKAAARAQAAILLAENLGDETALARCYLELGDAQWIQTRFAEAIITFGRGTHYAQQAGDRMLEARSLTLQAQTGIFTGMSAPEIETLLRQSLAIAEAADDKLEMANLYHKLAYLRVAQGMGEFDQAVQGFQQALVLARVIGHRTREEITLSNLGILFSHQGDYRSAKEVHAQSLQLVEALGNHWRRWSVIGYWGGVLVQIGDLETAHALLTQAGEGLQKLRIHHAEVKVRSELGLLYHLAGDACKAQEELQYLLDLLDKHSDLRYEALVRTRLGYVMEASNLLDNARKLYEQGRKLHDQMGQHYYAMNALAGLARVAVYLGDNPTALAHAQTIWNTIAGKETDATVETARTLRTCYEIFQQHGDGQVTDVLNAACAQLRGRAATIDDPAHSLHFWQLADHRFFLDVAR